MLSRSPGGPGPGGDSGSRVAKERLLGPSKACSHSTTHRVRPRAPSAENKDHADRNDKVFLQGPEVGPEAFFARECPSTSEQSGSS